MTPWYNLHNFEALFQEFLRKEAFHKNTVKNYASDMRHFFGWLKTRPKKENQDLSLTSSDITEYKQYLTDSKLPIKTINRRLSSVRKFCSFCVEKGICADNPSKNIGNVAKDLYIDTHHYQKLPPSMSFPRKRESIQINPDPVGMNSIDRPIKSDDDKTNTEKMPPYRKLNHKFIFIAALGIILLIITGYFLIKPKQSLQISNGATQAKYKGKRNIVFQGRLTDSLGNPIENKTDVQFKLYDDASAGKTLYSSQKCPINPADEGFFTAEVGNTCGKPIEQSIFLDNPAVYLGITVGDDSEMQPRQQIGNVEYSENSARLQGYPLASVDNENPEASHGAQINSIPVINQFGNLTIAAASPRIISTSGTFQLRGQALTLATDTGSAGDIVFNPDTGGNTLFASGAVGIKAENPLTFDLQIGGNAGPDKNSVYDLGSSTLRWNALYANQVIGTETGTQGYFNRTNNALSPTHLTDDLLLGTAATASANVKFSGTTSGNSFIYSGNLGLGTRNPQEKITLGYDDDSAIEISAPQNVAVKTGSGGALSAGTYYFKVAASDGLGWTTGSSEISCAVNGTSLTRCTLSWDTVIGATSYRVYKGTIAGIQDRYQTSNTNSLNYDGDGGATLAAVPTKTTAYISKWSSVGSSWLLGGNFGMGTTNPSKGKIQIDASRGVLLYTNNTGTGNSIEDASGAKLTAAGTFTDASDVSKKMNINPLSYGLSELLKLNPVQYLWKNSNLPDVGFIAQEVKKIIPEIVYGLEGNMSMSYGHLSAVIVRAIQEQQKQLNDLLQRFTAETIAANVKLVSPVIETHNLIATGSATINEVNAHKITTQEIKTKDGTLTLGGISRFVIAGLDTNPIAVFDEQGNATISGSLSAQNITAQSATVSGSLTADGLQTNTVAAQDATIEATLRAKTIESENITALQNSVATNTDTINEVQKLLAQIRDTPLPDTQYYQNLSDQTIEPITTNSINDNSYTTDLTVSNQSNLYNAAIANSLTVGSLSFSDDQLLSFSWELKLSALSRINLLDGAVTMAKDGTLTTKGTIIAQAGIRTNDITPINSSDKLSLHNAYFPDGIKLAKHTTATSSAVIIAAPDNFEKNGVWAPAIETEEKTAGVALVPAHATELLIYTDTLSDQSLIYLTPTSPTYNQTLFVAQKESCQKNDPLLADDPLPCKPYFKVALDGSRFNRDEGLNSEIKFNWWVVN